MHLKFLWLAALVVLPCLPSCGCGGDSFPTANPCLVPLDVELVTPIDASIDIPLDSDIVVTFSAPVVESTVNGQTFVVVERGGPPVPGTIFFSQPGLQAHFDPLTNLLPCTLYDVVLGAGVSDLCSDPLVPFAWSFTTTGVNCLPPPVAGACTPPIDFLTTGTYIVLAGATITNTGPTTLNGDLGLSPGSAVTGAPIVTGVSNIANGPAVTAKTDLIAAYDAAAAIPSTATRIGDIGGEVLTTGVYTSSSVLSIERADLVLVGGPDDIFVFQVVAGLTVASGRRIILQGGVRPCNVIWQVGSSAILETGSDFQGSILALTSITMRTGATATGRMLARNGQVSFESNVVTMP